MEIYTPSRISRVLSEISLNRDLLIFRDSLYFLRPIFGLVHATENADCRQLRQTRLAKLARRAAEADDRFSNDGLIQSGRNQLYRCRFDDVDLVVKCFPNGGTWKKSSIASFG